MLENLERATRKYRGPVWFVRLVIFKNGVKFLLKHRRFIQIGIEPGHRDRSTTSIHYGGLGPEDVETALVDFADHVGHENATLQQARDILE